jgi:hypothetical protein
MSPRPRDRVVGGGRCTFRTRPCRRALLLSILLSLLFFLLLSTDGRDMSHRVMSATNVTLSDL